MKVRVLFFASYSDLVGQEEQEVTVAAPATVADLLRHLRAALPGADRLPDRPLVAVNHAHSGMDAALAEGDEIALLPPMAGG